MDVTEENEKITATAQAIGDQGINVITYNPILQQVFTPVPVKSGQEILQLIPVRTSDGQLYMYQAAGANFRKIPQIAGINPTAEKVEENTPAVSSGLNLDEEPLYVNSKQYYRIMKRREARAKLEIAGRIIQRRRYMHESRHKHAMNRVRGEGGRFQATGSAKRRTKDQQSAATPAPELNSPENQDRKSVV